jgi:Skp family chaperone for outer membrane proteins
MIRWSVLAAAAAVVAGAAVVTGASVPPARPAGVPAADVKAKGPVIGQRIGFFNMAKVMKYNDRARTAVARLNDRKNRLTANLLGLRGMYTDLQAAVAAEKNRVAPASFSPDAERVSVQMIRLARQIEDGDREVNTLLNNQASVIIAELYDDLHAVVAEVVRENDLSAVLAYPDATTPEEANSPMIKELKLKPPAAQPFYLDPAADYTDEIIQRLNARYASGGK